MIRYTPQPAKFSYVMHAPPLCWDMPEPFVEMAVLASRYNAIMTVYDEEDRLVYANKAVRNLYNFFDFSSPQTFETMIRSSLKHSEKIRSGRSGNHDDIVAYANIQRLSSRLEFLREYPAKLICSHIRLPNGENAQLRLDPSTVGLDNYFANPSSSFSLMETIRRGEDAVQKAAALDCLSFGVAIVGVDRKVRHSNAAMTDQIRRQDGITLDDLGRFVTTAHQGAAELARLIVLGCVGKLPHATMTLSIRGSVPGHVHSLSVSPGAQDSNTAVVILAPARVDLASVSGVLHRDYGLTQAESEMAAMIGNGMTNEEITRETGRSLDTGRGHIKSIIRKVSGEIATSNQTGISRWAAVLWAITGAARSRGV